jgi:hypothetical protein
VWCVVWHVAEEPLTLEIELGDSSEVSLLIHETTRCYITEEYNPDTQHPGNLKSRWHLHVPFVFLTFNDRVAIKTRITVAVSVRGFLILTLDRVEWSAARCALCIVRGHLYILWIGGWYCLSERGAGRNARALTRNCIPFVHPLAGQYTDWAILIHVFKSLWCRIQVLESKFAFAVEIWSSFRKESLDLVTIKSI